MSCTETSFKTLNWINLKIFLAFVSHVFASNEVSPGYHVHPCIQQKAHTHRQQVVCVCVRVGGWGLGGLLSGNLLYTPTR